MLTTEEIEGRLRPILAQVIASYAHAMDCPNCKYRTPLLEKQIALLGGVYEALGISNDTAFDMACDEAERLTEADNARIRATRAAQREGWVGHQN